MAGHLNELVSADFLKELVHSGSVNDQVTAGHEIESDAEYSVSLA